MIYPIALLLLAVLSEALVARTNLPPSFTVQDLGVASDAGFPNVYRDGGGGGRLNGKNLIVYSDTTTTSGGPNDSLKAFTSNSIAYSDAINPLTLTDFGTNEVPNLGIPFTANESDFTSANWDTHQERIAIWPGSAIVPLSDGVTGIAVYPILKVNGSGYTTFLYNTLVTITIGKDGPVVERTVPELFYAGEIVYGGFSAAVSNIDGNILFFAAAGDGLKVARVKPDKYMDRSQYTYWTGNNWSTTPPSATSTSANVFSVPLCNNLGDCNFFSAGGSSGDVFFSPYHNTWLAIYFDGFPDNVFRMRYALEGMVTGEWSEQVDLYTTIPQGGQYNYAGHAYNGFEKNGSTLLSWTILGREMGTARVTWK